MKQSLGPCDVAHRWVIFLGLVACAPLARAQTEVRPFPTDARWKCLHFEREGKPASEAELLDVKLYPGNGRLSFHVGEAYQWSSSVTPVADKKLQEFDSDHSFKDFDDPSFKHHDQPIRGILAWDGKQLKMACSKPGGSRPTNFSTRAGDGRIYASFREWTREDIPVDAEVRYQSLTGFYKFFRVLIFYGLFSGMAGFLLGSVVGALLGFEIYAQYKSAAGGDIGQTEWSLPAAVLGVVVGVLIGYWYPDLLPFLKRLL